MVSALLVTSLLAAGPAPPGDSLAGLRRNFLEDGLDRVSVTATHRVIAHADGSLELQGEQPLRISLQSIRREHGVSCATASFPSCATEGDEHRAHAPSV